MKNLSRWRGLAALAADAVEHGASAIERVHLATLRRPFTVLEAIPGIALPSRTLHRLIAGQVMLSYGAVRTVTRGLAGTVDLTLRSMASQALRDRKSERD